MQLLLSSIERALEREWGVRATRVRGCPIVETSDNYDAMDAADANALYRLLEEEVVPAFYDRDAANVPSRWIAVVKQAIRTVAPRFSARRMVKEYVERMYSPALERRAATSESLK